MAFHDAAWSYSRPKCHCWASHWVWSDCIRGYLVVCYNTWCDWCPNCELACLEKYLIWASPSCGVRKVIGEYYSEDLGAEVVPIGKLDDCGVVLMGWGGRILCGPWHNARNLSNVVVASGAIICHIVYHMTPSYSATGSIFLQEGKGWPSNVIAKCGRYWRTVYDHWDCCMRYWSKCALIED